MAVQCTTTNYLYIADAVGAASAGYLDHAWGLLTTRGAYSIICSGTDATNDECRWLVTGTGASNVAGARTRVATAAENAYVTKAAYDAVYGTDASLVTNQWQSYAASYKSDSDRYAWVDGVRGTQNTASHALGTAPTYTRIGGLPDSTFANSALKIAEVSRWNTAQAPAMSQAQIDALIVELSTLDENGLIVRATTLNEDPSSAGYGRLIAYWPLDTAAGFSDLSGNGHDLTESATVATYTHPPVQDYPQPILLSSDPDPAVEGSAVTFTGTNLSPLGTDPTLDIGGVSQTPTASTNTTVTFTATVGGLTYGASRSVSLTNDLGETLGEAFSVAIIPANPDPATTTGERYVDVTETPATAGLRITATPDIAIGSQIHWKNAIEDTGGTPTAIDIDEIVIYGDGSISVTTPGSRTFPISVDVRVNNNDGNGWSAFITQSITEASGANPALVGSDTVNLQYIRGEAGVFDLSGLVTEGSWAWSNPSGSLPIGWSLDENTGIITPVEVNPGSYGPAVIRVAGDSTHVDLNVSVEVFHKDNPGIASRKNLRRLRQQAVMRPKIIADYDTLVSGLESLEGQNLYKDIEA